MSLWNLSLYNVYVHYKVISFIKTNQLNFFKKQYVYKPENNQPNWETLQNDLTTSNILVEFWNIFIKMK